MGFWDNFVSDWDQIMNDEPNFTIVKAKPSKRFYADVIRVWAGEARNGGLPVYVYYEMCDMEGVAHNDTDEHSMLDEVYKHGFTWHPVEDDE